MKRWLTILIIFFLVPLILGAKVLPIALEPPVPTFGKVMTIRIELPNDVIPSGLPALAPFAPLAAPTINGNEYRLELLPLRSGTFILPSIPFQRGFNEHFRTDDIPIEIIDDIPIDAEIISPPEPTRKASQLPQVIVPTLIVALGVIALVGYTRRRGPTLTPPSLDDYSGNELLSELDRRMAEDDELSVEDRRKWHERLDAARFSQPEKRQKEARRLLNAYRQHPGGDA